MAKPAATSDRILGYDLARAAAIAGMIAVHFSLAGAAPEATRPAWLYAFVHDFLDGRAAATFMVLAGVGLTLLTRRAVASADPDGRRRVRRLVCNRGLFLLAVGFLNLRIWPGDILRVYGVTLFVAAWMLAAPDRRLLAAAAVSVAGFLLLFVSPMNYDKHWDWETMTYSDLWTAEGVVRNLFYDGFRSAFPWAGFVFYGMWLGRRDLRDPDLNRRVLLASFGLALAAEVLSYVAVRYFVEGRGWPREDAVALFGTISMPPLPVFLLAAGATATAVISLSVRLASMPALTPVVRPSAATGRFALTWYLAHIVVGLGTLEALERIGTQTLPQAVATGLAFYAVAVVLSAVWAKFFRSGPLEALMRSITG